MNNLKNGNIPAAVAAAVVVLTELIFPTFSFLGFGFTYANAGSWWSFSAAMSVVAIIVATVVNSHKGKMRYYGGIYLMVSSLISLYLLFYPILFMSISVKIGFWIILVADIFCGLEGFADYNLNKPKK